MDSTSNHAIWSRAKQQTVTGLLAVSILCGTGFRVHATETARLLANAPARPAVSLHEMVSSSPLVDLKDSRVLTIRGTVDDPASTSVRIRVTTSRGETAMCSAAARERRFSCRYPADFSGAPPLSPCMLFVDVTTATAFDTSAPGHYQAEAALIIYDSARHELPELPSAFTGDLLDAHGNTDRSSKEWRAYSTLVNLYMHSRAARLAGVGRPDFDLSVPGDLDWFKNNLTLYEFDQRDRNWNTPLGNRGRRTFWQSVWNTWYNSSNDHPQDGNTSNTRTSNYLPYAFSNDFADTLIMMLMHKLAANPVEDNLSVMCSEGVENLLAMQHCDTSNFALKDSRGKRETYTAGAFRYGMFENGDFMSEGNGWFFNPAFLDYVNGGVFNGRCVWALGEALADDPEGPLAARITGAIARATRFCLSDALALGYARKSPRGNVYWYGAGEHAYLVLGLVTACKVAPDTPLALTDAGTTPTLRAICVAALNALADLELPHHQFSVYPNVDSVAIAALAEGAEVLSSEPDAIRWRRTAEAVADAWLDTKVPPREYPATVIHFGPRIEPDKMTFNWHHLSPDCANHNVIYLYQSGHWIDALSRLYALTGNRRYLDRATAIAGYLCGANPWGVRLFNEIGGVYNWVDDTNADGIEDYLKQDMYPESTDFCQIGIMHLLQAVMRD